VKSLGFIVLLAGCSFHATGQNGPADDSGSTGSDGAGPGSDAAVTSVDARICFGAGLLLNVCLASPPDQALSLPGSVNPLDTGVDANCQKIVPQTSGPELCVIAGKTATVSGSFVAIGKRPLVVIGADAVTVTSAGTLDVSSKINPRRAGAGANTGTCTTAGAGENDEGGGGGGAGGSFGTVGGKGGTGDVNDNGTPKNGNAPGGAVGAAQPAPAILRGGCGGGAGGDGAETDATHTGGAGGDGGGAVYLIAGNTITIAGNVFASGAGGGTTPGSAGVEQGGGGGGAGGMIGLDAPIINVPGRVVANGGGGGGGGGNSNGGAPGGDGTTTGWNTRAAGGNSDADAGDGADGTTFNTTTNVDGQGANGGGGGGAGGLGLVWIYNTVQGGATISPTPTTH